MIYLYHLFFFPLDWQENRKKKNPHQKNNTQTWHVHGMQIWSANYSDYQMNSDSGPLDRGDKALNLPTQQVNSVK